MEPIVCFAKCSGVAQNVRVIVQQYENDSPMLERVLFHALEYLADSVCVHEVENHRSERVALTYSSFGRENAAVRQDELVVHCVMRGKIWKQLGGMSLQGGMYVVSEAGLELELLSLRV